MCVAWPVVVHPAIALAAHRSRDAGYLHDPEVAKAQGSSERPTMSDAIVRIDRVAAAVVAETGTHDCRRRPARCAGKRRSAIYSLRDMRRALIQSLVSRSVATF